MTFISYNKVHHLGDRHITPLLSGYVTVEEKLDGSQFRIMVERIDGKLKVSCGSKTVEFAERGMDKNFVAGVEKAMALKNLEFGLKDGEKMFIFGEYFKSPKHNTLTYGRIPTNHVAVFDIALLHTDGQLEWIKHSQEKAALAAYMGFEAIPTLWEGEGKDLSNEKIQELLKTTSALGYATVEGIVIKNYDQYFDPVKFPYLTGMFMAGKFVRSEFTEMNREEWKVKKGSVEGIGESFRTEARWKKAIQHLRDEGKLELNMKDMAILIPELARDLEEEEGETIRQALYDLYRKKINSIASQGFAEFYKKWLLELQFKPTGEEKDAQRLAEFNAPT